MTYTVYASCGLKLHIIATFPTETEAMKFCQNKAWKARVNNMLWNMYITSETMIPEYITVV